MYIGQDLVDLQSYLNTLTADNFFQYDLNLGKAAPYLNIVISQYWKNLYPALEHLPQTTSLLQVYFTVDFSIPVADFITAVGAACTAYAVTSRPVWNAYYAHIVSFSDFITALNTKD